METWFRDHSDILACGVDTVIRVSYCDAYDELGIDAFVGRVPRVTVAMSHLSHRFDQVRRPKRSDFLSSFQWFSRRPPAILHLLDICFVLSSSRSIGADLTSSCIKWHHQAVGEHKKWSREVGEEEEVGAEPIYASVAASSQRSLGNIITPIRPA